ncbi:ferredoxin Fer [Natronococcus wangiae]|uniref:ferredoxin Fer n=1 Tax=Natronococcus wangiae TaxID=3068275 RepID=UPI00273EA269|nr:ferredoxin Fer [Natronococcus sp. AD5]
MVIDLPAVGPGTEDDSDEEDDLPPAELEYLDYRAVVEHGWDVDDDDLFERASEAELGEREHGTIEIDRDETLLRSAEANDLKWGSQCRSGTCNICTAVLKSGDAEMDMNLALSDDEVEERGLRLTCVCKPVSDELQVVFNATPEADGNPGG